MLRTPHAAGRLARKAAGAGGWVPLVSIVILYFITLDWGLFNNRFNERAALADHNELWHRNIRPSLQVDSLIALVEDEGGLCYRSEERGGTELTCVVDRIGRFPLVFVSHRWVCVLFVRDERIVAARKCRRQSGAT